MKKITEEWWVKCLHDREKLEHWNECFTMSSIDDLTKKLND